MVEWPGAPAQGGVSGRVGDLATSRMTMIVPSMWIAGVAVVLLHDPSAAEDVVQDAFGIVWKRTVDIMVRLRTDDEHS